MTKLESALKKALEQYGPVRKETFVRFNPKQDGVSYIVDYPYIQVSLDDWGIITLTIPNAPNPLWDGEAEYETEGEEIEDIVEWVHWCIDDALDGGPEDLPSGP